MDGRNPEDIRAETYANQNGSYHLGYGHDSEVVKSAHSHSTHKSSPTGRPRIEPGGGDLSRSAANEDLLNNPMSADQKAEVRRSMGHITFLLEKERLAYEAMMQRTEGDPRARAIELAKLANGK